MKTACAEFYVLPKDLDSPGIRLGILNMTCDAMCCIFNRCDSLVGRLRVGRVRNNHPDLLAPFTVGGETLIRSVHDQFSRSGWANQAK